jgi:hypothetical protein
LSSDILAEREKKGEKGWQKQTRNNVGRQREKENVGG